MAYLKLIRIRDWAKNLFIFIPVFFAGQFSIDNFLYHIAPFFSFCFIASAIYIINDFKDIDFDRKHPLKQNRPLVTSEVSKLKAIIMMIVLIIGSVVLALYSRNSMSFLTVIAAYFLMNLAYTLGLKNFPIIDILILSAGYVLRIEGGRLISNVYLSEWLIAIVFVFSIFISIAKRRDDVLIKNETGISMRKSINGYSIDYLNVLLSIFAAVIILGYLIFSLLPQSKQVFRTNNLYLTSIFVIAGVLRYLQIVLVWNSSGSPTDILFKDTFIKIILLCWVLAFFVIIYFR